MILTLIEHDGTRPDQGSLEALTLARRLAEALGVGLDVVLFGQQAPGVPAQLARFGVSKAHIVDDSRLEAYAPEAWAQSIVQLVEALRADVVIAAGTDRGNEVLAHVAARTGQAMAANCTDVRAGDPFIVTRQRWGGSLLEDARLDGSVRLLTIAAYAVASEEAPLRAAPTVERFAPVLSDADLRVRVVDRVASDTGTISLAGARVVVGGGRGVGSAEGFASLEELAGLLGGAVGVSRVVTSAGWRPHHEQIGQTGVRIAPDLYIACGISGAIQHLVGAKAAKQILAINTDAEAPIMAKASYAVIGDLHAILPAISAEIRRASTRPDLTSPPASRPSQ